MEPEINPGQGRNVGLSPAELQAALTVAPAPLTRVLFIVTQSEMGGAQKFLAQLTSQLDPGRFLIKVVAGKDGMGALKADRPRGVEYEAASRLRRNPRVVDDIAAVFELRRMIRDYRPDILFLNSSKAGFVGSLAARGLRSVLPGMRIIYRIGGWTFNDPWPWWKKLFYRLLERVSARWKDVIVVNSATDLAAAKKYRIVPRQTLTMIHNGINPYHEILPRDQARAILAERVPAVHQAGLIVGTIANFYPAKDLASFIRAADQIPDNAICVIIGDGPLRPALERQIRDMGLSQRVFLAGAIENAHRFVTAFDVFALSSLKEGFPWAVLEAMAAKVPVAATRVGAVPEIIEHEKNGLLADPGKPGQLAQAITSLLQDERLRRELAIQAHQTILKDFSLHAMAEQYEKLFLNP